MPCDAAVSPTTSAAKPSVPPGCPCSSAAHSGRAPARLAARWAVSRWSRAGVSSLHAGVLTARGNYLYDVGRGRERQKSWGEQPERVCKVGRQGVPWHRAEGYFHLAYDALATEKASCWSCLSCTCSTKRAAHPLTSATPHAPPPCRGTGTAGAGAAPQATGTPPLPGQLLSR